MNKIMKVGFALAASAAVAFAAGCADHVPVYQCGRVDYKSMASCKGVATSTTTTVRRVHRRPVGAAGTVVQQY